MNVIKNINSEANSEEISALALLKILYQGKIIIIFSIIVLVILGVSLYYFKNLNQNFTKDFLILEKTYLGSKFDELRKLKLEMEEYIDEINSAVRGNRVEDKYVEFFTIEPHIFFRDLAREQEKDSFLPNELLQKSLSYNSKENDGVIKFIYSFEEKENFELTTKFIKGSVNNSKETLYFNVDNSFLYLENFIESKIKEEEEVLNRLKFLLKVNREIFLENIKEYNDVDAATILYRLNSIFSDAFIKLDIKSNIPNKIKLEILDSEFSDFQDLKRKYDAFLNLEVSHLNMYKTLKENKNKLNNFKSKIITMLDNTDFVDLIEKDMVKMNQVNLINVALISIILGLSLGIMIILFRHSIKS